MEEVLLTIGHSIALVIEAIAMLVIMTGTIESMIAIVRVVSSGHNSGFERRAVWLTFAQWLVAGLTFHASAARAPSHG